MTGTSDRETRGHVVAALGAAALLGSLWLPWWSFRIPAQALNAAEQVFHQFGALGPLLSASAQLVSRLGPFHVTAWQALHTIPDVLLVVGVIAGGLSGLAATGRASNVASPTVLAGIVGILLVGYRLVVPPAPGGFLHLAWGIFVALAGAAAVIAGGAIAGSDTARRSPDLSLAPLPPAISSPATPLLQVPDPGPEHATWSAAGSVPPPTP